MKRLLNFAENIFRCQSISVQKQKVFTWRYFIFNLHHRMPNAQLAFLLHIMQIQSIVILLLKPFDQFIFLMSNHNKDVIDSGTFEQSKGIIQHGPSRNPNHGYRPGF